jgi:hypothetical protein
MLRAVSSQCDHERIFEEFGRRWSRARDRAIAAAYVDPHADQLFARMLDISKETMFAAHLGDLDGDAGESALERAAHATGRGSRDLRCAALLALAKRRGEQASATLLEGLTARDRDVKDYAVIGLAGAGDDRAWDDVFALLPALLRRTHRARDPSEVETALGYLAQHVDDAERRHRLVAYIRAHWSTIGEDQWFSRFWPPAGPTGPPIEEVGPPSAAPIRAWARDPLFKPLGPPLVLD